MALSRRDARRKALLLIGHSHAMLGTSGRSLRYCSFGGALGGIFNLTSLFILNE